MTKINSKLAAKPAAAKTVAVKAPAKAKAVKAVAVDPDLITSVSPAKGDADVVVVAGKRSTSFRNEHYTKALTAAAVIGGSFSTVTALVAAAKLAAPKKATLALGVDSRTAPHATAALKAANDKARDAAKAIRAAKPEVAKTEAGNRSTKGIVSTRNGDQKIVVVAKANPYKPGSKAAVTFDLFAKAKTVAGFKELVAAKPGAFDAGYIRYSARDGYITVG